MLRSALIRMGTALAIIAPQAWAQTPREVAEKVMPSVVVLVMEDEHGQRIAMGSGFVVRDGVIATNFHVIEGAARGYAWLVDEKAERNIPPLPPPGFHRRWTVKGVVASDAARDLAILSVEELTAAPLVIGDSEKVAVGDAVYVVGNPQGLEGTFSSGIVSAIRRTEDGHLIQITAPISPGSSGGPVLNGKGEVIGVAFGMLKDGQNLNFAIPAKYLANLLAKSLETTTFSQQFHELLPPSQPVAAANNQPQVSVQDLRKCAEQGDLEAMYKLGDIYSEGQGFLQNDSEAVRWYRKAAEAGHSAAMYSLGLMYGSGRGVEKDDKEMVKWLRKAAEGGYKSAYATLAFFYEMGEGKDAKEAAIWWRKSAENGLPHAMRSLGLMNLTGRGVPQNAEEAAKWLRLAAEKYRQAAEGGDTTAMLELADMYDFGEGVAQDEEQAAKWCREAARKGMLDSMNLMGKNYRLGFLCDRNPSQAVRWFQRSAENGNADGMFNLGCMYASGEGVPQDDLEAVNWYRKAAEKGHAGAMHNLGLMYLLGRGVPQDDREAVNWYRKAAGKGEANAMCKLGIMYDLGRGVPKDAAEAYVWYSLGAAFGKKDADEMRDSLAKSLTVEVLLAAQERSRELFKQIRGGTNN